MESMQEQGSRLNAAQYLSLEVVCNSKIPGAIVRNKHIKCLNGVLAFTYRPCSENQILFASYTSKEVWGDD